MSEKGLLKILLIQTAFTGDVILATAALEKLHRCYPEASIDILLRKGNEGLFAGHPFLNEAIVWDKKSRKLPNLLKIAGKARRKRYDIAINFHRFASSGIVMYLSGAKQRAGFDKNPFSFCYTHTVKHIIGDGKHEIDRNNELIAPFCATAVFKERTLPRIYPQPADFERIAKFSTAPYICIAPASVWFTKQFPTHKWIEFIKLLGGVYSVNLLGSGADRQLCNSIKSSVNNNRSINNLAGELSLLESAALMKNAVMNYVNDSAPMHLASAVNAPVVAIFCSTVPAFGFGPLSDKSFIAETKERLDCRPCGLHGRKTCPRGHFRCAETIRIDDLLNTLQR